MNFSAPVNSLSFGYCSFHLLNQFFKRNIDLNLFPIGENIDISSYPAASLEFQEYLRKSANNALDRFSRNDKTLSLWHITNGSEQSFGTKRNLFTFFELSELTPTEVNILNNQDTVFVTNDYTKKVIDSQCKVEVVVAPLGFDNLHFKKLNRRPYNDDRIVFSLFGKLETARKRHAKVIQNWIKKFGGDRRYQLHLHVYNPHLSPEQNSQLLSHIIGNKPFNVNILPHVRDLVFFNQNLNAADIVMDLGTEGFSIPSFSAVALGKHGVILNFAGLAQWANPVNSVMVNHTHMIEPFDNMFFHKGAKQNQGLIADFDENEFIAACEIAIDRFTQNPINIEGLKLQEKFNWSDTVDTVLNNLK